MPLYMDYHIISDVTIDEVKKAHIADLAVQERYNVRYHQFWVNEEAGTVFCLIEGPDKETCAQVHREAHGNIACNIVEVEGGFYNLVMGRDHQTDHGLVLYSNGAVDTGFRFVLAVDISGITKAAGSGDSKMLILPDKPKDLIRRIIPTYQGREIRHSEYNGFIAVFNEAAEALACAVEIQTELLKRSNSPADEAWDITFKIGIGGGQPLTEDDDFFEKTIKLAQRLSLIAREKEIVASTLVRELSGMDEMPAENSSIKPMHTPQEKFLENLFDITEDKLSDSTFNVERLSRDMGISRPQLYRKITSATGRSPNEFIRDLKMNKALSLVKEEQFNISEIALMVGYNNPSYFSKCFRETYGIIPSRLFPDS